MRYLVRFCVRQAPDGGTIMPRTLGQELLEVIVKASCCFILPVGAQLYAYCVWGPLVGYLLLPVLYALGVGLNWFLGTKLWGRECDSCDGVVPLTAFTALYAYLFALPALFRAVSGANPWLQLGLFAACIVVAGVVLGYTAKWSGPLANYCRDNPFPGIRPTGPLMLTV